MSLCIQKNSSLGMDSVLKPIISLLRRTLNTDEFELETNDFQLVQLGVRLQIRTLQKILDDTSDKHGLKGIKALQTALNVHSNDSAVKEFTYTSKHGEFVLESSFFLSSAIGFDGNEIKMESEQYEIYGLMLPKIASYAEALRLTNYALARSNMCTSLSKVVQTKIVDNSLDVYFERREIEHCDTNVNIENELKTISAAISKDEELHDLNKRWEDRKEDIEQAIYIFKTMERVSTGVLDTKHIIVMEGYERLVRELLRVLALNVNVIVVRTLKDFQFSKEELDLKVDQATEVLSTERRVINNLVILTLHSLNVKKTASFPWDLFTDNNRSINIYVQYTYARLCGILKQSTVDFKLSNVIERLTNQNIKDSTIKRSNIETLSFHILQFRALFQRGVKRADPSLILSAIQMLCKRAGSAYNSLRVKDQPSDVAELRFVVLMRVQDEIEKVASILNIKLLNTM